MCVQVQVWVLVECVLDALADADADDDNNKMTKNTSSSSSYSNCFQLKGIVFVWAKLLYLLYFL